MVITIKATKINMKIKLMRRLDYWIGIPICFILSTTNSFIKFFTNKKRKLSPPKNILFIKPSEIGSIILSYPLMQKIKEDHKDANLFFLTFKSNIDTLKVLKTIPTENIIEINDSTLLGFIIDTFSAICVIHKEKIDTTIDLEFFSRFTSIISYLSGAKLRVGFYKYSFEGLYRGNLLTHKIQSNPHIHISQQFFAFSQALAAQKKDSPELKNVPDISQFVLPKYSPTYKQKENTHNLLTQHGVKDRSKLFLINPGEGLIPLREWPLSNFIDVTHSLLETPYHYVIIIGTSKCSIKTNEMVNKIKNDRIINLCGKTSIEELLGLFTAGEALISNDSGLAHLASLTAIKQFIFFGPETPKIFSPLTNNAHIFYSKFPCSPCLSTFNHRESCCINNECLKIISPQAVIEEIKNI